MVENLPLVINPVGRSADHRRLRKDLRTLIQFVSVYCKGKHCDCARTTFQTRLHGIPDDLARDVDLCEDCQKLLSHALVKRLHCPMNPKPACKRCPKHCYHPRYREEIRQVMRYSGRELLLSGRIDYLLHLLF